MRQAKSRAPACSQELCGGLGELVGYWRHQLSPGGERRATNNVCRLARPRVAVRLHANETDR